MHGQRQVFITPRVVLQCLGTFCRNQVGQGPHLHTERQFFTGGFECGLLGECAVSGFARTHKTACQQVGNAVEQSGVHGTFFLLHAPAVGLVRQVQQGSQRTQGGMQHHKRAKQQQQHHVE